MLVHFVYLSGSINGPGYKGCTDWREYATAAFQNHIQSISPMRAKRYLQNDGPLDHNYGHFDVHPLSRSRVVTARGHFDTLRADALIVNLLGAETVSRDGMFMECADFIFHSLDEAIEGVVAVVSPHDKLIHTRLAAVWLLRDLDLFNMQEAPETHA